MVHHQEKRGRNAKSGNDRLLLLPPSVYLLIGRNPSHVWSIDRTRAPLTLKLHLSREPTAKQEQQAKQVHIEGIDLKERGGSKP